MDDLHIEPQGKLFVVSGPAGCGKTTICSSMMRDFPDKIGRIVTATTRKPRTGEVHGIDYYFFSKEEFAEKLAQDAFYENATVYGNFYGILKEEVHNKIQSKGNLFLSIDVQGVQALNEFKKKSPFLQNYMVSVFIMPPSIDELKQRLAGRNTDEEKIIEQRLAIAEQELEQSWMFDYCILSSTKEDDLVSMRNIFMKEQPKQ